MKSMETFSLIQKESMNHFIHAKTSHNRQHTKRVLNLSVQIGEKEKADLEILKYAAVLHDIGRNHQDESNGEICHAEKGALLARELLNKFNVESVKIEKIVHCIEAHRFRGDKPPRSLEAKVLFDADKLDSIGAIGIGRAFLFAGEVGARLHDKNVDVENTQPYTKEDTAYREFKVKLSKIYNRMLTDEGKRIADERHNYMVAFFHRLNKEVEGEL
jgi:uncharacterized protein